MMNATHGEAPARPRRARSGRPTRAACRPSCRGSSRRRRSASSGGPGARRRSRSGRRTRRGRSRRIAHASGGRRPSTNAITTGVERDAQVRDAREEGGGAVVGGRHGSVARIVARRSSATQGTTARRTRPSGAGGARRGELARPRRRRWRARPASRRRSPGRSSRARARPSPSSSGAGERVAGQLAAHADPAAVRPRAVDGGADQRGERAGCSGVGQPAPRARSRGRPPACTA